ncbi:hypothetical protein N7462_008882 [Penicillium macrosclerotiorum]|uniref:uncharacterized protein n=1 Tax=Penicillium macrosclerotiorum TaxID=303699 RepID=UPI002546F4F6|nr:uncharacterized protein N7462_008882 [Penicillium macrosclerotiorum]KAJ5675985.1 hypothetical protein N7462_008882 [Penicillium macrosclerotiorum]
MPSVSTELTSETLEELLNQKALTPITPSDYEAKTAVTKLSYREKAILALSLARCLLEFIDDDMELASHSWKPESIYFLKSAGTQQDRAPYISLKPSLRGCQLPESLGAIGLGNPVLLSFAKLLLEIDIGERIKKEIDYESNANLSTWVWMCGFVDEVEQTGGGNFLQAVKGCLYLHVYKAHYQSDDVDVGYITRKVIYEQIVRQLERVIHTQSLKRKRQGSVSEPPLSKKPSIDTSALEMGMQLTEVSPNKKIPWIRPASRADFEVAVVCALPLEFDAICTVVDEFWDEDFGKVDGDQNMYTNARIGKLNIVILLLPNMGKVSAASTCASLRSSYPGISLVLVTGVCGAVPFLGGGEEILLGDVIISRHIIQYDLGRQYPDEFKTRDTMNDRLSRAPKNVRNLLALVDTNRGRERLEQLTSTYLEDIQTKSTQKLRGPKYRYPGASQDRLFQPDYRHQRRVPSHATTLSETHKTSVCASIESHKASCDELGCDSEQLVLRKRIKKKLQREEAGYIKESQAPLIFVGTIGSGDTVMRSGEERDKIASTHGLLAFEMEGAGVWDEMPCIVIKGVCDYADSHKSKNWQDFAAATAASATKALMSWYIHRDKTSRA